MIERQSFSDIDKMILLIKLYLKAWLTVLLGIKCQHDLLFFFFGKFHREKKVLIKDTAGINCLWINEVE